MHTLSFTLKQHTPIIHFQHYQKGATLRGTEVKPKLDKFLVKYLQLTEIISERGKEKIVPKKKYADWFNNPEKLSLDYKIHFIADDSNIVTLNTKGPINRNGKVLYETDSFPMMLSNMGGKEDRDELKNFSFHAFVTGILKSANERLLSEIDSLLADFFVLHNFGNRQNKGFGSFTRVRDREDSVSDIIKKYKKNTWYWEYKNAEDSNTVFNDIAIIYSLLKTGINFPDHPLETVYDRDGQPLIRNGREVRKPDQKVKGKYRFYRKSFLYHYVAEKFPYGNEKRFIKEKFFGESAMIENDGTEKKYVRGILGVAIFNEFRDLERTGKIVFKSEVAERYASPIVFKVIDKKVYYFLEDSNITSKIMDKLFVFENEQERKTETIRTPANFDEAVLLDMLQSFQKYFNKLIDTVDDSLFALYKNGYNDMPLAVRNIIDVLNYIEIKNL